MMRTFISVLWDASRQLPGHVSDVARQLPGRCADAARKLRGHGLAAVTVADWSWTGRGSGLRAGHTRASARTLHVHCPEASRILSGCYADDSAGIAPDATPDAARKLRDRCSSCGIIF